MTDTEATKLKPYTEAQVARLLEISQQGLRYWRVKGWILPDAFAPRPVRPEGVRVNVLYNRDVIDAHVSGERDLLYRITPKAGE